MPYNHSAIELRLKKTDEELDKMFDGLPENVAINDHKNMVKHYYNQSYIKAKKGKTAEAVAQSYEDFVTYLKQVRNNELTAKDMKKNIINKTNNSRRADVFLHDLGQTCKLIFWAATAVTLFASVYLFALPMLLLQLPVGIAMSITILGGFLATMKKCFDALCGMRTFKRHNEEYGREVTLLGFFAPKEKPATEELRTNTEAKKEVAIDVDTLLDSHQGQESGTYSPV